MSDDQKQDAQPEAVEEKQTEAETLEAKSEGVKEGGSEEEVAEEAPTEKVTEETPAEEVPIEKTSDEGKVYLEKLDGFEDLKPGQTVRVHEKIHDLSVKGEKRERIQVFEGIILGLRGGGISRTMTVRKLSGGVAVEKIYPINSPVVAKIELVKIARVRRAKLGFLKDPKRRFKRKLKETHIMKHKKGKKR